MFDVSEDGRLAKYLIVAFKRVNPEGKEHWLNKLAVYMTKRRSDRYPCGHISHVEIMFEVKVGVWYRCSINKMTGFYQKDGKIKWVPGKVHYKQINRESMQEYDYFQLPMPRAKQAVVHGFCLSQVDGGFNFWGYVLNFFLPFWRIGTRRFDPEAFEEPNNWFCSELIVAALQSGGYFTDQEARATSPNDLYRLCSYNDFAFVANPKKGIYL